MAGGVGDVADFVGLQCDESALWIDPITTRGCKRRLQALRHLLTQILVLFSAINVEPPSRGLHHAHYRWPIGWWLNDPPVGCIVRLCPLSNFRWTSLRVMPGTTRHQQPDVKVAIYCEVLHLLILPLSLRFD